MVGPGRRRRTRGYGICECVPGTTLSYCCPRAARRPRFQPGLSGLAAYAIPSCSYSVARPQHPGQGLDPTARRASMRLLPPVVAVQRPRDHPTGLPAAEPASTARRNPRGVFPRPRLPAPLSLFFPPLCGDAVLAHHANFFRGPRASRHRQWPDAALQHMHILASLLTLLSVLSFPPPAGGTPGRCLHLPLCARLGCAQTACSRMCTCALVQRRSLQSPNRRSSHAAARPAAEQQRG